MANLIAFLWGFAEATLFFIIPDVGLSIIALQGSQAGLTAAGYALLGALCGGALMYFWGKADFQKASGILRKIPLIPPKDIAKVQADLEKSGAAAMLFGPLFGIPYKIYAVYAHRFTSFTRFLVISLPARGLRFVITALLIPLLVNRFFPEMPYERLVLSLVALWGIVYFLYFIQKRKSAQS